MIITNEKQFQKLNENGSRALENTNVFILSHVLSVKADSDSISSANQSITDLTPPKDLLDKFIQGDIGKKQFKKEYKKHLKSEDNQFFLYTIARSVNDNHALPIFVCSDDEWETGYLKVFADVVSDMFGLEAIKVKDYLSEVSDAWKDAKRTESRKKKRVKEFKRGIKSLTKEKTQLSLDGIKQLEKLDKKFAIDRMMIYASTTGTFEGISRKKLINAVELYEQYNKKTKKRVNFVRKDNGLSKNKDKWSRQEAASVIIGIYNDMHGDVKEEN